MESTNLYLLSTYLKKWSFNDHRITLNYSFNYDVGYERNRIEMRIGSPANMVNEFLNSVFHTAKDKLRDRNKKAKAESGSSNSNNIILVNEPEIKRKLGVFLSKINKEFNQNKRSRGRSRMISTRSLDFYYNDFEFEPLAENIKFYVHLNRGVNKMNGDLWNNAVDDFRLALEIKEDDILTNKFLARALNKLGRFKEAINHLKIYSEAENTPESLSALAAAYIQLESYIDAENLYKKIAKQFPDSYLAQFGQAQLAYKQGKAFKTGLDKIWKIDPNWLKEKLRTVWEYKLPQYADNVEAMWNAATAARYLGFERPFDLTRRAFNDEIPSYFDSDKGTIRFVKAEIDAWVDIMNSYQIDGEKYQTFADRLSADEKKKGTLKKKKKIVDDKPKNNEVEEDFVL